MLTALVFSGEADQAPPLEDDLTAVGLHVLDVLQCTNFLHDVLKLSPDLVVVYDPHPTGALFDALATLHATAPRPVIVFTSDPDAGTIANAVAAGIHAYVVNGYSRTRLRSVIHLAQARFRHDHAIRDELADVNRRFSERKLVDRAKGILMGAQQLREEEAYRALRSAAMKTKQRVGQVSQRVIEGARYAEAINRAGQFRMLSQRLVKLYALACAGWQPARVAALQAEAVAHVEGNIALLTRTLSAATFGDLLEALTTPWHVVRPILDAPPVASRLPELDRHAEAMLLRAEQLTVNLEITGFAATLHVINVAGRQRMLSQRLAKQAVLQTLLPGPATARTRNAMAETEAELVQGMAYLAALPLGNDDLTRTLAGTATLWATFQQALRTNATDQVAELSEALLAQFEQVTDNLERSVQALL